MSNDFPSVPWPSRFAAAGLVAAIAAASMRDESPSADTTAAPTPMPRATPSRGPILLPDQFSASDGDASARSDPRIATGIAFVELHLAQETPRGRGVMMGHVEAGNEYLPRIDSDFGAVRFLTPRASRRARFSKISGHADATARLIYSPTGLAPGVDQVLLLNNWEWIGDFGLRVGSLEPPTAAGCRVMTHSWAFSSGTPDAMVLRRLDYLIEHENVIVVSGVENGGHSAAPGLIASAYNGIAVGVTRRSSSGTGTQVDGVGRCKPELVGDMSRTSYATPIVAAVAARLVEAANRRALFPPTDLGDRAGDVLRVEVIKAAMLAGADKSVGFEPAEGSPLDPHHGAGAVRFDRSLEVLWSGPVPRPAAGTRRGLIADAVAQGQPTPIDRLAGWDYRAIEPGGVVIYDMTVPVALKQLSIAVVWNRHVDGWDLINPMMEADRLAPLPLADVDLRLIRPTREHGNTIVARSTSSVDNLEHIHLRSVQPGEYRIDLRRKDDLPMTEHVAIAWWSQVGE